MDVIGQIVKDIIDLKLESDNIPSNATLKNMYEWYSWAFEHGIIEVTYKYGQMQGYIEWLRLDEIPKSRQEVMDKINYDKCGSILYISNCCVRDDNKRHGILWKLTHLVREKNSDCEYVCWHENNDGKIQLKLYENNQKEEGGER